MTAVDFVISGAEVVDFECAVQLYTQWKDYMAKLPDTFHDEKLFDQITTVLDTRVMLRRDALFKIITEQENKEQ